MLWPDLTAVAAWLAARKDAIAAVQSLVTILAIFVGGWWAYFKIIKGRVYRRRLEPSIRARLVSLPDHPCAVVTVTIENVGLTRVDIDRESSTIETSVYAPADHVAEFHNAMWRDLGTTDALRHHDWVEPGEVVSEERLFALPDEPVIALGLRLTLLPKRRSLMPWARRTEWNALAVATPDERTERPEVQPPPSGAMP